VLVHVGVKTGWPMVNIRQYWVPESTMVPTRTGLCLKPSEWKILTDNRFVIRDRFPGLEDEVRCSLRDDHQNQEGMLQCGHCNPFSTWSTMMQ
jgi:hypothetical protein